MKCIEGSKGNLHWDLGSVGISVNFRALEKSIWVLEKCWKFVSEKGYKPIVVKERNLKLLSVIQVSNSSLFQMAINFFVEKQPNNIAFIKTRNINNIIMTHVSN